MPTKLGREIDDALAHERLTEIVRLIDEYGALYDKRWDGVPGLIENPELDAQLNALMDRVRARTRLAHGVIKAMGDESLTARVVEHKEPAYGGHPFTRARIAIIEAIAVLAQREELAEIVGPVGPRLSASELHHLIWGAAAGLWDDGHYRQAVQTAAASLEGLLQAVTGPSVSGENLAALFTTNDPTAGSPRLRLRGVDPQSKTWKSAHEGAAALVRGAFLGVRNLMSHPGWPEPDDSEALEMLAVLSHVAHLIDRCDTVRAK